MLNIRNAVVAALALATASLAFGQSKGAGDWLIGATSDNLGMYAATVNDSGAILGQYCYPENGDNGECYWILANDTGCEVGSKYPALVNSDAGAVSIELVCFKRENGPGRYAFSDFDLIDGVAKGPGTVGIAFPMASGLFQVNRFSLEGSSAAIASMRSRVANDREKMKSSTKNKFY